MYQFVRLSFGPFSSFFYILCSLFSFCFVQVVELCLWRGEDVGSALVVRLLVPGAVLGLWAASDRTAPCWQYFNSWRLGVAILGLYMD